jgi:hypothetical protein
MQEQETMSATQPQTELFVKMAVTYWESQNQRVDKLIDTLTDEQMTTQTAPGRNTGIYLLGHLAAVNDSLHTIMGWGERLHPELDEPFLKSADNTGHTFPPVAALKEYWHTINRELTKHISAMPPEQWLERHMSVSPEDFAKEPTRNRLNVLMGRTIHQGYHLGQMNYLNPRKAD